jgi:hypothetical protein
MIIALGVIVVLVILYFVAQLITPVGLAIVLGVFALIWLAISQMRKRKWERGSAEREKQWKAEEDGEKQERQDRRKKLARERAEVKLAFGDLDDQFAVLLSSVGVFAESVVRASVAIGRGHFKLCTAKDMIFYDIDTILDKLWVAGGCVPGRIDRFCDSVVGKISPEQETSDLGGKFRLWSSYDHEKLNSSDDPVELPMLVRVLAVYDSSHSTRWASEAALAYRKLLLGAVNVYESHTMPGSRKTDSLAVRMVTDAYLDKLLPYIPKKKSASAPSPLVCAECQQHYMRLGIPTDATRETIKQRYRDLCNVWHPDRFEHNERLRDKATKEFQEMQQAFDHIDSHFEANRAPR